jgi:hypothetical protein
MLDEEYTPKYHDDSAMRRASHGINDLPYIRFSSAGIEADNSPLNIYARGALHLPKGATAHCSDKTRQHLAKDPVPSSSS